MATAYTPLTVQCHPDAFILEPTGEYRAPRGDEYYRYEGKIRYSWLDFTGVNSEPREIYHLRPLTQLSFPTPGTFWYNPHRNEVLQSVGPTETGEWGFRVGARESVWYSTPQRWWEFVERKNVVELRKGAF